MTDREIEPTRTSDDATSRAAGGRFDRWHWGVAALPLGLALGIATEPYAANVAFLAVPAIYLDIWYVRSLDVDWSPNATLWLAGSILLLLFVGPYYVYRRCKMIPG